MKKKAQELAFLGLFVRLKIVKIQKNKIFLKKISVIFEPKYSEKRTIFLLVGKINRIYDIYVRQ
ncbi:hypothetical protein EFP78_08820 [Lactobacillus helveticus]|nr:hypothetical protein NB98_07230 [Lactobacillus helveticus]KGL05257.1 hypothetical protein MZ90_07330 [Lactobacillus helveticus]MCT3423476.1 hypothetical protein [Lactobacillus helveticus]